MAAADPADPGRQILRLTDLPGGWALRDGPRFETATASASGRTGQALCQTQFASVERSRSIPDRA